MKKSLAFFCSVCFLLSIVSLGTFPMVTAETSGDYTYEVLGDGTVKITKYTGIGSAWLENPVDVVIPQTLDGRTVSVIGQSAFVDCDHMISITIPDSVVTIEDWAFKHCGLLQNVTFPKNLQWIGYGAFAETMLRTLDLPYNPSMQIKRDAFYNSAYYNTAENWTGDVLYADEYVLAGKRQPSQTTVTIREGTKLIADYAFYRNQCSSITLPSSLEVIGARAFFECRKLTSVTIPRSVRKIDTKAFELCTHMTAFHVAADNPYFQAIDGVLLSKDRTVLVSYPVDRQAKSYTVPAGVKMIADTAFKMGILLETIELPDGLVEIGEEAFRECSNLANLELPSTVRVVKKGTFDRCPKITRLDIPDGVQELPSAFLWACDVVEIRIPASVTTFGDEVFSYGDVTIYGVKGSAAEEYTKNSRDAYSTLIFKPIEEWGASSTVATTVPTAAPTTPSASVVQPSPSTAPTTQPTTVPSTTITTIMTTTRTTTATRKVSTTTTIGTTTTAVAVNTTPRPTSSNIVGYIIGGVAVLLIGGGAALVYFVILPKIKAKKR